jgi:hypothetical protein
MRRIYKKASKVNVWLGKETNHSIEAMEVIKLLASPPSNAPGEKTISYPKISDEQVQCNWKALQRFFQRQWFERAWIRQEVCLHPEVTFSWGSSTINIQEFEVATKTMEYIDRMGFYLYATGEQLLNYSYSYHAEMIIKLRKDTSEGKKFARLTHLLVQARNYKSTDYRDKVFSVLGLADPDNHELRARYQLEVHDVYLWAAKALLPLSGGLDLLMGCQNPECDNNLPSWAPNLSAPWKYPSFVDGWVYPLKSKMKQIKQNVSFEGNTMVIHGCYVDAVGLVCDQILSHTATNEEIDAVYAGWDDFMTKEREKYEKFEAISWKNLTAAKLFPGQEETPQFEAVAFSILSLKHVRTHLLPSSYQVPAVSLQGRRSSMKKYGTNRRLAYTVKDRRFGIFPSDVKLGDKLVTFHGSNHPFVLREVPDSSDHVLVGDAHFGLMVLNTSTVDKLESTTFRIV